MPVLNRIASFHDEMVAWRRQIHSHPETHESTMVPEQAPAILETGRKTSSSEPKLFGVFTPDQSLASLAGQRSGEVH